MVGLTIYFTKQGGEGANDGSKKEMEGIKNKNKWNVLLNHHFVLIIIIMQ